MAKEILFNEDAKNALQKGINKVGESVGSTMGPSGKTVIIANYVGAPPFVTKDGVTVANCIQLEDEIENAGAMMIKQACAKTAKDAGDGTTQTAVLAQELIRTGLKAVKDGANPQEVKAGIDSAVECVVNHLNKIASRIGEDNDKVRAIATTSANNDIVIGQLIADAYKKIGYSSEALLLIEESGVNETSIHTIEGVQFDNGYMSPDFVNNKDTGKVEHQVPLFLIADYTISTIEQLAPIFDKLGVAKMLHHPVIIIAPDFEGSAFSSMRLNHLNPNTPIKCCLIRASSAYKEHLLEDIAVATGATVIKDSAGLKLETAEIAHLGAAVRVVVSERKTEIFAGANNPALMEEHKKGLKNQMADMKDEALKEIWQKRLSMLCGSVGVISVGGATDVEMKERKDRVDDACRAVRSSLEEGYVAGGGTALLRCMNSLNEILCPTRMDFDKGVHLIGFLCQVPLSIMLKNAGSVDGSIVNEVIDKEGSVGFNVKKMGMEDLIAAGIIDPVKVIRCALQNAASVAGAVITSDCFIIEMKAK